MAVWWASEAVPLAATALLPLAALPLLEVAPVASVATSCAFMMPVATPPSAIVYASGHLQIADMARAGLWLNLAAIAVITLAAWLSTPG